MLLFKGRARPFRTVGNEAGPIKQGDFRSLKTEQEKVKKGLLPDENPVGEDSCDLLSNEARLNLSVKSLYANINWRV